MAASRAGEWLTLDETRELEAYKAAGKVPPEKFDGVIFDSTRIQGAGYRFPTDSEQKAIDASYKERQAGSEVAAKLEAKMAESAAGFEMPKVVDETLVSTATTTVKAGQQTASA